jgi:hypothetical protein
MERILENNLFPCLYKTILGIDCPICGFQRSFFLFLNGDFIESFKMYPPLLPSLLLIVAFVLKLLNRRIINIKYFTAYASLVLSIIIINYILKISCT